MEIVVDNEVKLVSYYPYYKCTLEWYQDADVVHQVDNRNKVYDLDMLKNMYNFLNKRGSLFYIKYKNRLCGDVCLLNDGFLAIVVAKPYQNKHIGRRAILKMIELAKEKNMKTVFAEIFDFNEQSKKMFFSVGFVHFHDDIYKLDLK